MYFYYNRTSIDKVAFGITIPAGEVRGLPEPIWSRDLIRVNDPPVDNTKTEQVPVIDESEKSEVTKHRSRKSLNVKESMENGTDSDQ